VILEGGGDEGITHVDRRQETMAVKVALPALGQGIAFFGLGGGGHDQDQQQPAEWDGSGKGAHEHFLLAFDPVMGVCVTFRLIEEKLPPLFLVSPLPSGKVDWVTIGALYRF
jgi:hypothetical protein